MAEAVGTRGAAESSGTYRGSGRSSPSDRPDVRRPAMSEIMKAALYARVSTEDQVEKFGLPLQVRAFQEYLDRYGLEDAGEELHFIDEGYSGSG